MKRTLLCIALVTFHVIVCYAAMAQDIPSVPLTKPIDPKLINITGTWNYSCIRIGRHGRVSTGWTCLRNMHNYPKPGILTP